MKGADDADGNVTEQAQAAAPPRSAGQGAGKGADGQKAQQQADDEARDVYGQLRSQGALSSGIPGIALRKGACGHAAGPSVGAGKTTSS
jgi:hypothetical protein